MSPMQYGARILYDKPRRDEMEKMKLIYFLLINGKSCMSFAVQLTVMVAPTCLASAWMYRDDVAVQYIEYTLMYILMLLKRDDSDHKWVLKEGHSYLLMELSGEVEDYRWYRTVAVW